MNISQSKKKRENIFLVSRKIENKKSGKGEKKWDEKDKSHYKKGEKENKKGRKSIFNKVSIFIFKPDHN